MGEFQPAHPMEYARTSLGRVYVGETSSSPPLQVRPNNNGNTIVIELEDITKMAGRVEFGIEEIPIFRFALHPRAATALCCHLIHALALTDDRVAKHLEQEMQRIMETLE